MRPSSKFVVGVRRVGGTEAIWKNPSPDMDVRLFDRPRVNTAIWRSDGDEDQAKSPSHSTLRLVRTKSVPARIVGVIR